MENRGLIVRRGFWRLAPLWLPAGVVAAVVGFVAEAVRASEPVPLVTMAPMMAASLVLVAPCGLPLALAPTGLAP